MEKHIIIIGGGFGGLKAARILSQEKNIRLTVLDRRNYHLFQPLLYQVATASLNPSDIGVPIRQLFASKPNTTVLLESVQSIDLKSKKVITDSASHSYDFLILACGSTHSYFGNDDWEEWAPGLKTIEHALEIRRRILTAFESAEKEKNLEKQIPFLTFIIVGGGPTGVELAGALAELAKSIVKKEFRNIDPNKIRVLLIEGSPRLLSGFQPSLSENAKETLQKKGVEIILNEHVKNITKEGVSIGEQFIETATVIWAAGVKPSKLNKGLGAPMDKAGRVLVQKDLSIPNFPEVYVIGDQAHFETPLGPLPSLAPVAMQQGVHAAKNIIQQLHNLPTKNFHYTNKGILAVIGRSNAVAEIPGLGAIKGFPAWIFWIVVHIFTLVGFRNRILVFINWSWSYFTSSRGARLITRRNWEAKQKEIT